MAYYSKEFKEKMITRMLQPNNKPVSEISKETNISITTIDEWKKSYISQGKQLTKSTNTDRWDSQNKFLVVV